MLQDIENKEDILELLQPGVSLTSTADESPTVAMATLTLKRTASSRRHSYSDSKTRHPFALRIFGKQIVIAKDCMDTSPAINCDESIQIVGDISNAQINEEELVSSPKYRRGPVKLKYEIAFDNIDQDSSCINN